MKIRSLAEAENQWTRYLEANEGSPGAFFGQMLGMAATGVSDWELESIKEASRRGRHQARGCPRLHLARRPASGAQESSKPTRNRPGQPTW